MKNILWLLFPVVFLLPVFSVSQEVQLDHVDGRWQLSADSLVVDGTTPIVFYLRLRTDQYAYQHINNGFRCYSPDSLSWTPPVGDTLLSDWKTFSRLSVFTIYAETADGINPDTVGFGGASFLTDAGLPPYMDTIAYSITLEPFPVGQGYHGKTLCLDSSFYGNNGQWLWKTSAGITTLPTWSGPYCFTLVEPSLDAGASETDLLPAAVELHQNYPNPFNPSTSISFNLTTASNISLTVYNLSGEIVRQLISGYLPAGEHRVNWDGKNESNRDAASGIYFYRLSTDDLNLSKKMTLIR